VPAAVGGFTLTVTAPGVLPEAGVTVSQDPPEADTVNGVAAVAKTEMLCGAGAAAPCCMLKLNPEGATFNWFGLAGIVVMLPEPLSEKLPDSTLPEALALLTVKVRDRFPVAPANCPVPPVIVPLRVTEVPELEKSGTPLSRKSK
jgi:hypothetical protein